MFGEIKSAYIKCVNPYLFPVKIPELSRSKDCMTYKSNQIIDHVSSLPEEVLQRFGNSAEVN